MAAGGRDGKEMAVATVTVVLLLELVLLLLLVVVLLVVVCVVVLMAETSGVWRGRLCVKLLSE